MAGTAEEPDRTPFDWRSLWISIAMLGATIAVERLGSDFIASEFTDRPRPRDLLFELLPHVSALRFFSTAALAIGALIYLRYVLKHARGDIPEFIAAYAMMHLIRTGIMILDPLANAHGAGGYVFPIVQNGMFPSGHMATAVMFVRFIDARVEPGMRRAAAAAAVAMAVSMILSHGHYGIDMVGGVLLAYFVEREWRDGRLFAPVQRLLRGEVRQPTR